MSFDREVLEQLFHACDKNKSGYLEREDLRPLCLDLELTEWEFEDVYQDLDVDKDGVINLEDFVTGVRDVCQTLSQRRAGTRETREQSLDSVVAWERFLDELGLEYYLMSMKRYGV